MGLFTRRPTESPYGRSWPWWRHQRRVWLNPLVIRLAATPVDQATLAAYVANPRRRSADGNEPCVVHRRDRGYHAIEGKHRILAARQTGRKIRVRLAEDRADRAPRWWR